MDHFIYYLIGFFVVVFIARMMGEKANKYLNTEQKAGLIDIFSADRKKGLVIIFGLVIVFLLLLQFRIFDPIITFGVYFLIIAGYLVFKNYRTNKKLTANSYPKPYIKMIIAANIIATIGIIAFFSLMMIDIYNSR